MNKFKNFAFIFLIIVLVTGCGKTTSSTDNLSSVKDENIINSITSQVIALTSLPKTIELYKKDSFKASDYNNEDILLYGLISSFSLENNIDLTDSEKEDLKKKKIEDVTSYLNIQDVETKMNDTFNTSNVSYNNVVGVCPSFIYDADKKIYYVKENCSSEQPKIISFIEDIKYDGNLYYAIVYSGFIDGKKVYNNVNKETEIASLSDEQFYVIDIENKNKFSKYTYKFTKNSDGKYLFTDATK